MITKEKINQAGYCFIGKSNNLSKNDADNILKGFRLIHQHPMTLFRHTIDRKLKKHNINALVSQRLKRIPSIVKKLEIQENMQLSRMQDIGGLRIVVDTIQEANLIRDEIKKVEKHRNFKFTFANEKNYIETPADSGYRSIHMVYKYDKGMELRKQCRVEIQIRTRLQHAWATAVEVTGTFSNQLLKQSLGNKKYLNIFKKISKLFISLEEKKIDDEFVKEVKQDIENAQLLDKLRSFTIASKLVENNSKGKYLLLKMNFEKKEISASKYSDAKFEKANEDYLKMELEHFDNNAVEVVLLSIQDIKKLRQSYPNYFMDTTEFIKSMDKLFKLVVENEKQQKIIDSIKDEELKKIAKTMSKDITKKMLKLFDRSKK
ncbi:hypothetical protein [uncultured Gammaproteobacteria bacterium]|nr:hypothetical protein [uncultured Gammaproteobacteria bacterium]